MCQVTCDMWHMTSDTLHVTCDTLHVTDRGRCTFSWNFGSPALTAWEWRFLWRFGGQGWPIQWMTKVFIEQPWLHRVCLSCYKNVVLTSVCLSIGWSTITLYWSSLHCLCFTAPNSLHVLGTFLSAVQRHRSADLARSNSPSAVDCTVLYCIWFGWFGPASFIWVFL